MTLCFVEVATRFYLFQMNLFCFSLSRFENNVVFRGFRRRRTTGIAIDVWIGGQKEGVHIPGTVRYIRMKYRIWFYQLHAVISRTLVHSFAPINSSVRLLVPGCLLLDRREDDIILNMTHLTRFDQSSIPASFLSLHSLKLVRDSHLDQPEPLSGHLLPLASRTHCFDTFLSNCIQNIGTKK